MPRALRHGNYAVYVLDERGSPHHRPHAHIKHRGRRVASVYLETMSIFDVHEPLPDALIARIRDSQELLLNLWVELNGHD